MSLPWASSLDVSYVGQRAFNRHASRVNLNAVDLGTAYLAEYQDLTRTPSATPGATALTTNLLRPFRGLGTIQEQKTVFWEEYHSIQTSFNRRFRGGMSFGANYTYSLSHTGNSGLTQRLQHAADGTISIRADQAEYERLNETMPDYRPHVFKGNVVWDLPDLAGDSGARRAVGYIVNDWQLSGILTAGSGTTYNHELLVPEQRVEREPDRLARLRRAMIVVSGRPRLGVLEQPVRAVQRGGRRPGRTTAASASSRAGATCVGVRTGRWISRSRATSGSVGDGPFSCGWTPSTRSTRSTSRAGRRSFSWSTR